MTNLIFFVAGFISFKLLRLILVHFDEYQALKKSRSVWVKQNFDNRLKYDKRLVR